MAEHPIICTGNSVRGNLDGRKTQTRRVIVPQPVVFDRAGQPDYASLTDPKKKWQVGDTLWAKEDYKYIIQGEMVLTYYKYSIDKNRVEYTPLNCLSEITRKKLNKAKQDVWKSKLLMFKFMARIFLEILGLRCEKVQDISWEDIIAEGCDVNKPTGDPAIDDFTAGVEAIDTFHWLWDSINAKRGYGWSKNPFCWVIEFRNI